jgi:DNA replication protein DnaC
VALAVASSTSSISLTNSKRRRAGRQGRIADYLCRKHFVILDELGYLPFALSGGQLLFHLISIKRRRALSRFLTGRRCVFL